MITAGNGFDAVLETVKVHRPVHVEAVSLGLEEWFIRTVEKKGRRMGRFQLNKALLWKEWRQNRWLLPLLLLFITFTSSYRSSDLLGRCDAGDE